MEKGSDQIPKPYKNSGSMYQARIPDNKCKLLHLKKKTSEKAGKMSKRSAKRSLTGKPNATPERESG